MYCEGTLGLDEYEFEAKLLFDKQIGKTIFALNIVGEKEWKNEMDRIISLGLNGYKRRKESRNDCLV